MVARYSICAWAVIATLVSSSALVPEQACAQSNPTGTNAPMNFYGEGFVLLQHGAVIQGFVKPQAESITVIMDKGKQVSLAKKQILFVGPSIDSLYKYQTRAIRKWGTGEHWHLAQWCIQNGMLDQAIEHYLELEKQAADNPKFKQLDLQLKQALLADQNVRRAMAEQGIEPPINPNNEPKSASTEPGPNPVVQASATIASNSNKSDPAFPVHTVPGYLRKSFQTEITPIVVSRCGQSGCHGMLTKNTFQVFQPVGQQAASINERNLENVLRFVDAKTPDESDLLHYAARPHGAQRNSSFNLQREEDRIHLEKLAKWIRSLESIKPKATDDRANPVIQAGGQVIPAAIGTTPRNVMQDSTNPNSLNAEPSNPVQKAAASSPKLSKPPKSGSAGVAIDASELAEIEEEIRKLEKIASKKSKPSDPFDAKIFNSKYGNAKPDKKPLDPQ